MTGRTLSHYQIGEKLGVVYKARDTHFYSERDGFRCIWAQRLDATTKRPQGDMFSVYHLHHARRSLMRVTDLDMTRLTAVPGRLVLSLGEYAGNIWMGEFRTRQ